MDHQQTVVVREAVFDLVERRSRHAAAEAKAILDGKADPVTFQVGDSVLVENMDAKHKLEPKWDGPHKVVAHPYGDSYVIQHATGKQHKVHVRHLRKFDASRSSGLEVTEAHLEGDQFIVNKIVGHRVVAKPRGKRGPLAEDYEFLVRWEGHSEESDSWEPPKPDLHKTDPYKAYCAEHSLKTVPWKPTPYKPVAA